MSNHTRMYGVRSKSPELISTPEERQKRATRVLAGMKIHSSHVKTIQIGDDLVDVPKIEYMQLLEKQVRDTREKMRSAENKIERLMKHQSRLADDIKNIKIEFRNILR
jgi:hypothetical protein